MMYFLPVFGININNQINFFVIVWTSRTVWKVSLFGVFLVRIVQHLDWIRKDTSYLCIQSKCGKIQTRKTPNTDSSRNVGVTSFCSKKAWFFWGCNSCDLTHLRLIFLSYITVWKVSLFRVFLVHIFSHLDLAFRKPHHAFSVFNPNPGKYGREKLRIRTLFTHW